MATGQLGTVVRHLHRLAGTDACEDLSDTQLLERFLRSGDQGTFAALVRRHGPLVLGVCRRLLRDGHLAEDAFQATFLVLLRRARSLGSGSLAGWLYTVAYRVSLKARTVAARNATSAAAREQAAPDPGDGWDDLRPILDEELERLPEIYRLPVILCYLQGRTNREAARQLGWPVGTVKGRLSRARDLLRQRLSRRGITLGAAALTAVPVTTCAAAVPAALVRATVSGDAPPAARALAEGAIEVMFAAKLKCAGALALTFALAAFGVGAFANQAEAQKQPDGAAKAQPAPAAVLVQPLPELMRPFPRPEIKPVPGKEITVSGRVLDAQGKPAANAAVTLVARPGAAMTAYQLLGQVKADRDGKFRMAVRPPEGSDVAAVATAADHAAGWHWPCAAEPIEIRLPRAETMSGRLVDLQGAPAVGVRVEVTRLGEGYGNGSPFWADRDLSLSLGRVAEFYDPDEGESDWAEVSFYQADTAVRFARADALVVRKSGMVRVWDVAGRNGGAPSLVLRGPLTRLPGWPETAVTDAQGRFTLRGLPAGQAVGLLIRDPRYALQLVSLPPRDKGKAEEFVRVLSPARTVEGVVTDTLTGKPIPHARVAVEPPSGGSYRLVSDGFSRRGNAIDLKGRPTTRGDAMTRAIAFLALGGEKSLRGGELPPLEVEADEHGRFRMSLFEAGSYRLIFGHPDRTYLPRVVNVSWPKREIVRQRFDVDMAPAVQVRGKVTDGPGGKAVEGARVDFWNKDLKLPDGVRAPRPIKTKADGTFAVHLPAGSWHIVVNAPEPVYEGKALDALKLAGGPLRVHIGNTPAEKAPEAKGAKVYPDGWAAVELKPGGPRDLTFELKRAPAIRGRVVGPDGKPAAGVRLGYRPVDPYADWAYITTDPPLDRLAVGGVFIADGEALTARKPRLIAPMTVDLKDGTFAIPVHDARAQFTLTFHDGAKGLAATVEVQGKQAGGEEVVVRLRPCGSAKARFVGPDGKPLMNFRPVLFQILPPGPVPVHKNVPGLIREGLWATDALWAGHLDPQRHSTGPKTDADGNVVLPALVPGATYRVLLTRERCREFTVEPGQALDLGTLTVQRPHEMTRMPAGKQ